MPCIYFLSICLVSDTLDINPQLYHLKIQCGTYCKGTKLSRESDLSEEEIADGTVDVVPRIRRRDDGDVKARGSQVVDVQGQRDD